MGDEDILALMGDEANQTDNLWDLLDLQVIPPLLFPLLLDNKAVLLNPRTYKKESGSLANMAGTKKQGTAKF